VNKTRERSKGRKARRHLCLYHVHPAVGICRTPFVEVGIVYLAPLPRGFPRRLLESNLEVSAALLDAEWTIPLERKVRDRGGV
jgi:hypothetical protein